MSALEFKASKIMCQQHGRRMKYIHLQDQHKVRCSNCSPISQGYIDFEIIEDLLKMMKDQQKSKVLDLIINKKNEFNQLLMQICLLLKTLSKHAEEQLKLISKQGYTEEFFSHYLDDGDLTLEDIEQLGEVITENTIIERDRYRIKDLKLDQDQISSFDKNIHLLRQILDIFPAALIDELRNQWASSERWREVQSYPTESYSMDSCDASSSTKQPQILVALQDKFQELLFDSNQKWQQAYQAALNGQAILRTFHKSEAFLSAGLDVLIWTSKNGRQWASTTLIKNSQHLPTSAAVSSDDAQIAIGRQSGTVDVLDMQGQGWRIKQTLNLTKGAVFALAFNSTGSLLLAGGADGVINVFQLQNSAYIQKQQLLPQSGCAIKSLVFCTSSNDFVSSSTDNTVKMWVQNNELEYQCRQVLSFQQTQNTVAFNHDSSMLVTGGEDCAVRFWRRDLQNQWIEVQQVSLSSKVHQMKFISSNDLLIRAQNRILVMREGE